MRGPFMGPLQRPGTTLCRRLVIILLESLLEACHGEACSPPRPGCDIARPVHRPRTLAPLTGERAVHEQPLPTAAPLIDPFGDGGPSCDFPSIDLGAWVAAHGASLPSYPVVFVPSAATAPMLERWRFPDAASFVAHFAAMELWLEPGYTHRRAATWRTSRACRAALGAPRRSRRSPPVGATRCEATTRASSTATRPSAATWCEGSQCQRCWPSRPQPRPTSSSEGPAPACPFTAT